MMIIHSDMVTLLLLLLFSDQWSISVSVLWWYCWSIGIVVVIIDPWYYWLLWSHWLIPVPSIDCYIDSDIGIDGNCCCWSIDIDIDRWPGDIIPVVIGDDLLTHSHSIQWSLTVDQCYLLFDVIYHLTIFDDIHSLSLLFLLMLLIFIVLVFIHLFTLAHSIQPLLLLLLKLLLLLIVDDLSSIVVVIDIRFGDIVIDDVDHCCWLLTFDGDHSLDSIVSIDSSIHCCPIILILCIYSLFIHCCVCVTVVRLRPNSVGWSRWFRWIGTFDGWLIS